MAQFGSRFLVSGSNDARASLVRTFARALENGSPRQTLKHFIYAPGELAKLFPFGSISNSLIRKSGSEQYRRPDLA